MGSIRCDRGADGGRCDGQSPCNDCIGQGLPAQMMVVYVCMRLRNGGRSLGYAWVDWKVRRLGS